MPATVLFMDLGMLEMLARENTQRCMYD